MEYFLNTTDEYCISYKKIGKKVYNFYIENVDLNIIVRKANRTTYNIYKESKIIGTIKKPYFGKKTLFHNNMINCLLVMDKNIIYIPPKCINTEGFNSFISDNLKEIDNHDMLNVNSKIVTFKNKLVFSKYNESKINDIKINYFIVRKPLNIIQGIALALLLK